MSADSKSVAEQTTTILQNTKKYDFQFTSKQREGTMEGGYYTSYTAVAHNQNVKGIPDWLLLKTLEQKLGNLTADVSKPAPEFTMTIVEGSNSLEPIKTVITDTKALSEFINLFKQKYPALCQPSGSPASLSNR